MARGTIDQLTARITALEQVCADMYQVAGAIGAPLRVLDQLAAAVAGRPLPHETVLPFDARECVPLPSVAAAAMGRKGGSVTSRRKAKSSRVNGRLHGGRPAKFVAGDQVIGKRSAPAAIQRRLGIIVRRASNRSSFLVKFEGTMRAEQVRSWQIDKA